MHSKSRLWRFICNQSNGWSTLGYSPEHTNLLSVSIERHLKARIRFRDNMALFTCLVFIMRVRMKPLQLLYWYKMMIIDYTISLLTCGLYHISDQRPIFLKHRFSESSKHFWGGGVVAIKCGKRFQSNRNIAQGEQTLEKTIGGSFAGFGQSIAEKTVFKISTEAFYSPRQ
jgi:hypothetical protein